MGTVSLTGDPSAGEAIAFVNCQSGAVVSRQSSS
jgi:hypothetical protein